MCDSVLAPNLQSEVARSLDLPAVDATAAIGSVEEPNVLYVDAGGHLNRRGAELVGAAVAAVLGPLLR
ncbi:MAG: hypothetical protein KDC98_10910 [Planctomycetes bacterium]|nr:hypothetical protein [Planctomycetota bacterium]